MDLTGAGEVSEALTLVGELLAAEGHEYAVTILGGAALNLLGIVERTTTDVDILAFATPWSGDHAPAHVHLHAPPEPVGLSWLFFEPGSGTSRSMWSGVSGGRWARERPRGAAEVTTPRQLSSIPRPCSWSRWRSCPRSVG